MSMPGLFGWGWSAFVKKSKEVAAQWWSEEVPEGVSLDRSREMQGANNMTTSAKQKQANKKNALKSTGPKTKKGKAVSKYNAVKHGLTAASLLLPDENQRDLKDFADDLYNDIQPKGALESLLAERIVFAGWKLRRLGRVEAGIYTWNYRNEEAKRAEAEASSYTEKFGGLEDLFESVVTNHQAHDKAMAKAHKAGKLRDSDKTILGRAFVADSSACDALGKLNRYETTISRSMFTAIRELRRMQKEREEGND